VKAYKCDKCREFHEYEPKFIIIHTGVLDGILYCDGKRQYDLCSIQCFYEFALKVKECEPK